jgi:hypothetical protein
MRKNMKRNCKNKEEQQYKETSLTETKGKTHEKRVTLNKTATRGELLAYCLMFS